MRILIILTLFIGCSSQPLKFKYSFSKRYLASLTNQSSRVHKIEAELKDKKIFASGMDSTFITLKAYDEKGNPLNSIDPTDLTISSNEDIEAKPFVFKQGAYKAEILPRARSKSVKLQIDWQGRVASPILNLETTILPLREELEVIDRDHTQLNSWGEVNVRAGLRSSSGSVDEFYFDNLGNNKVINTKKIPDSSRNFSFDYPDQARQNISMEVIDFPSSVEAQGLVSLFMLFPRKNLPIVEQLTGTMDVTLPTGEKMIFSKESKEVVGGVFEEGVLVKDQFPDLKYRGRGVILRANGFGHSPQLIQNESEQNTKIDGDFGTKGSVDVLIINGSTGQRCRRPKEDFWEQVHVSLIEFKFPTDSEFHTYLKQNCGFGLPQLESVPDKNRPASNK